MLETIIIDRNDNHAANIGIPPTAGMIELRHKLLLCCTKTLLVHVEAKPQGAHRNCFHTLR